MKVGELQVWDAATTGRLTNSSWSPTSGGRRQYGLPDRPGAVRLAEVHLSVGSRQTPLPQRVLGRNLFRPRTLTGRHGVQLHPRASDASGTEVTFADGTALTVGAVIWATGFGTDHSWIDLSVFDTEGAWRTNAGSPRHLVSTSSD